MQRGFFYDFSNYGSYDRLMDDGLSDWHPAFLSLGTSLDICAAMYRNFCKKYRPKSKPERKYYWGSKLLAQFANLKYSGSGRRKRKRKTSPGQLSLWDDWEENHTEINAVAEKFVLTNCFDPKEKAKKYRRQYEQDIKPLPLSGGEQGVGSPQVAPLIEPLPPTAPSPRKEKDPDNDENDGDR